MIFRPFALAYGRHLERIRAVNKSALPSIIQRLDKLIQIAESDLLDIDAQIDEIKIFGSGGGLVMLSTALFQIFAERPAGVILLLGAAAVLFIVRERLKMLFRLRASVTQSLVASTHLRDAAKGR